MFITWMALMVMLPMQEANYDESKVPQYQLPDPLVQNDGTRVREPAQWTDHRRDEILQLFKEHVYGTMPPATQSSQPWSAKVVKDVKLKTKDGEVSVRLKEVQLKLGSQPDATVVHLAVFLPPDCEAACPAFLAYNFLGNHSLSSSDQVSLNPVWNRQRQRILPTESSRGARSSRWPVERIVAEGFALVTLYYGDVDPDFDDGFNNGVHAMFPQLQNRPDNWSSIGAWAWGLHRVMDYLASDSDIDTAKVVLMGHSRLGKTALWAGATDERYSIVVSNNSGCGGAALARRQYGETVQRINTVFPHWFCKNHRQYGGNEAKMPVDQHMLISLIAPRPIYIASAVEDRWADPRGEFLSALHAQPVWQLFGKEGLGLASDEMPAVDQPVGREIRYHVRSGKHDVTNFDWEQYLGFASQHLHKRP